MINPPERQRIQDWMRVADIDGPVKLHGSGLPDFSRHNVPKREKYTKWPQHISSFNSHKIYQLAVKWTKWQLNIPTSYIARLSKIYPNLDFWFKN
jgi:hypothetical protein